MKFDVLLINFNDSSQRVKTRVWLKIYIDMK